MEPDVSEYLDRKGWEILKRERKEIILKVCPLCRKEQKGKNDRNFYINSETGVWVTYCCQRKGNLITLKRELGDLDMLKPSFGYYGTSEAARYAEQLKKTRGTKTKLKGLPPKTSAGLYHKRLMDKIVPKAFEYLTVGRGFTKETLEYFQVGVARRGYCKKCKGQTSLRKDDICPWCETKVSKANDLIALPYILDGTVINFKFRSIPPGEKRFEKWEGAPTSLFNVDALDGEYKTVFITEGEMDAMSLYQFGYGPAIATATAGKNLDDEALESLALYDEVMIAYDNDEAGKKGSEKLSNQIGKYRCRRIEWPLYDINDCLRSGVPKADIKTYIEGAASFKVSSVKPFSSFVDDIKNLKKAGPGVYGVQTQWGGVNHLLGGLRDGEMTIVTGDTGSGKSTWTTAIAWDIARGSGRSNRDPRGVLIASFEMPVVDTVRKLVTMEGGQSFKHMSEEEIDQATERLAMQKLFFVDQYGEMPLAELRDAIEYGVRRYGLWLVILDHLHFFIESSSDNERHIIDFTLKKLKKWCLKLGIHMLLVVHPAKLRYTRDGEVCKPDLNDLKGSSSIKQTTDNVVRIWRPRSENRNDDIPPYAEFTTLKVRSDFGNEDTRALRFDKGSLRYTYISSTDLEEETKSKKKGRGKKKKTSGKAQLVFDRKMAAANDLDDKYDNENEKSLDEVFDGDDVPY